MSNLIDRDAPHYSPEWCAYQLACVLEAYAEPVPPGRMGRVERDALAVELGRKWAAKNGASCAWHEIAAYRRSKCYCHDCRPDVRRFA